MDQDPKAIPAIMGEPNEREPFGTSALNARGWQALRPHHHVRCDRLRLELDEHGSSDKPKAHALAGGKHGPKAGERN